MHKTLFREILQRADARHDCTRDKKSESVFYHSDLEIFRDYGCIRLWLSWPSRLLGNPLRSQITLPFISPFLGWHSPSFGSWTLNVSTWTLLRCFSTGFSLSWLWPRSLCFSECALKWERLACSLPPRQHWRRATRGHPSAFRQVNWLKERSYASSQYVQWMAKKGKRSKLVLEKQALNKGSKIGTEYIWIDKWSHEKSQLGKTRGEGPWIQGAPKTG